MAEEQPPQDVTQQDEQDDSQPAAELTGELWGTLGPLTPPEGCEKITPDGAILKHVLLEGTGNKPNKFARCLVHYIGRIQSTGYIFIDSRTESQTGQPVKVIAGRHTSPTETGLYMGVESMRVGERAVIYVEDYKYGYGEKGSFSFPAVPPEAKLAYEVEVVDFEEMEDDKTDSTNLMYEERLERAEKRRMLGNQLFKEGRYKEALAKYAGALSYMDEDFMMQLEGFYEDKANEIKIPIHLNMAACQLKIKDYHTTIYNCSEVLKVQPDNSKALYRRGVARHALQQTEEALKDLTKAAEKDPEDKAIKQELYALKQTMKEERAAQAKLYKGAFKFPDVVQQPANPSQETDAETDAGLRQRRGAAVQSLGKGIAAGERALGPVPEAAKKKGWLGWLLGILVVLLTVIGGLFTLRPGLLRA